MYKEYINFFLEFKILRFSDQLFIGETATDLSKQKLKKKTSSVNLAKNKKMN